MNAPVITIEQQVKCCARELRLRRHHYPRWVADGKMSQREADYEIAAMYAVLETVRAALPPDLLTEAQ
jgi:hypothetical protein